ncbi:unnamed protein product [Prorocentrum cordatum]|uniref:Transmembrane protein n=1 Tax=Prorocentrum cordatum TaxID=2364126 RepID=A0ABN9S7Q7_9DINO|nr:unnamed protein product [Polarella glacialis]
MNCFRNVFVEDDTVIERLAVQDGEAVHRTVPPERWCLFRKDFAQFQRVVRNAIFAGAIVPTRSDRFDLKCPTTIGPSIYTVVDQFIKAVTLKAGSVSWALMLHPGGVPCDLYITHAWAEGVHEFVDKVWNSWPRGAGAAYCCFLSNPLNLNIADLIATPSSSPFAKALSSARCMLVIPNHEVSIYRRMWCCYEAYLGYSLDKEIYTATASIQRPFHLALMFLAYEAIFIVMMLVFAYMFHCLQIQSPMLEVERAMSFPVCLFGWFVSVGLPRKWMVITCNVLCALSAACWCAACVYESFWQGHVTYRAVVLPLIFSVITLASVLDDALRRKRREESRQLTQGFKGRMRDASCSSSEDRGRILDEVSMAGVEQQVDEAIAVLVIARISTKSLRNASMLANRPLEGIGDSKFDWLLAGVIGWIAAMFSEWEGACVPSWRWFGEAQILLIVACIFSMKPDKRWFAAVALGYSNRTFLLVFSLSHILAPWHQVLSYVVCAIYLVGYFVILPLAWTIIIAGPHGTAQIPLLGPWLVRHLVAVGSGQLLYFKDRNRLTMRQLADASIEDLVPMLSNRHLEHRRFSTLSVEELGKTRSSTTIAGFAEA